MLQNQHQHNNQCRYVDVYRIVWSYLREITLLSLTAKQVSKSSICNVITRCSWAIFVQLCIYVPKTAWAHLYEFFPTT